MYQSLSHLGNGLHGSFINHRAVYVQDSTKPIGLMSAHITDVRLNHKASNGEVNIRDEIVKGLSRPAGQKILPQILLYDEEGLRIFDEITTGVDDYYIFPAEENLLKRHAHDIVQVMHGKEGQPVESVVLELGAG